MEGVPQPYSEDLDHHGNEPLTSPRMNLQVVTSLLGLSQHI